MSATYETDIVLWWKLKYKGSGSAVILEQQEQPVSLFYQGPTCMTFIQLAATQVLIHQPGLLAPEAIADPQGKHKYTKQFSMQLS